MVGYVGFRQMPRVDIIANLAHNGSKALSLVILLSSSHLKIPGDWSEFAYLKLGHRWGLA